MSHRLREPVDARRDADPNDATPNLGRQLVVFTVGLLAVYTAGVVAFWPEGDEQPSSAVFLVLMFAPAAGAVLARLFAGGQIRWGRPNRWLLAGLLPAAAALAAYLLAAAAGWVEEEPSLLWAALAAAPVAIGSAALSAVGEEIGWRGFLWPLLRDRWSFLRTAAVVIVVWWVYHVPLVLLGWYGSLAGLPAFTVAIVGVSLFIGVLTDRSGSLWPSVVVHGAWNGLVATSFAVTEGSDKVPAFAGSEALLGEFGWLAATAVFLLGVAATAWHVGTGAHRRA